MRESVAERRDCSCRNTSSERVASPTFSLRNIIECLAQTAPTFLQEHFGQGESMSVVPEWGTGELGWLNVPAGTRAQEQSGTNGY
jgi:hypothetical protein